MEECSKERKGQSVPSLGPQLHCMLPVGQQCLLRVGTPMACLLSSRRASHCLMSCSSSGSHPVQVTCCFERRYGRRLSRGRKKRDPHSPGSALLPLGKERQLAPILCAPSTQVRVVPKRCYHSQSCVITSQASCSTRTSLQPPDPAMCPMDVAK